MTAPYRDAEYRPASTPLRTSWWGVATNTMLAASSGALAYVIARHVAEGAIGYLVAGLVALVALLFAREIPSDKLGTCPACRKPIEVPGGRYAACPCGAFLESDRGQLLVTPEDRVARATRFGVEATALVLPDACAECGAPATRRLPLKSAWGQLDVPYCAAHGHAVRAESARRVAWFRSLPYARRVAEASAGRVLGPKPAVESGRWSNFGLGALFLGMAAAAYWGLAALDHAGYVIVPGSLKGVLLWLLLELFGRLWVTVFFVTVAAACFGFFIGSFKPRT